MLEEIIDHALASTLAALVGAPDDPTSKVRAAVETIIGEFTDDPRRARIVFVEAFGSEPMMTRRFEATASLAGVMRAVGPTVIDLPAESDDLIEAVSLILTGGIAELVIAWVAGRLDLSRDDLIDTCTEVLIANARNAQAMAERPADARAQRMEISDS